MTLKDTRSFKGNIIATFNILTLNIFQEFIANQYIILAKSASKSKSDEVSRKNLNF
ncbi:hypothetical protein CWATWH0402_1853 [Crocosphaera watsonii WH 0402]|uniref:Uncharacterized protein n=3 Tax=Crocosphaera watsonii TaxID=263511 RepID=T2JHW8_CROWT|nr:hypothetical protein CWATWH0003_3981 [Crocosphaera watsonii WH 0003]CCQ62574.1 hypothetical protein CWATWH0401_3067 [Crocosphaera watsonii WH 0401]CCQ64845.1 hypothetical protein CWATWH0402_1853 [Crocosphaera watsonii WH 0402]